MPESWLPVVAVVVAGVAFAITRHHVGRSRAEMGDRPGQPAPLTWEQPSICPHVETFELRARGRGVALIHCSDCGQRMGDR